jgi:hypothetical protein
MTKKKKNFRPKKKVLKTITLGHRDNPSVTLCNGHVNVRKFKKAWEAEGWDSASSIRSRDLRFEYWVKLKHTWKKSEQGNYDAQAVTVMDW